MSGPLLKMGVGGFQNWPTREKKGGWELIITKKHIYFLEKEDIFELHVSKMWSL